MFARLNPGKRRVRFPDEVMFEESIKESDGDAIMTMLRRASVDIDVDRINMSGMTALHQVRDAPQPPKNKKITCLFKIIFQNGLKVFTSTLQSV